MYTSYNEEEEDDDEINLDSKPSNPDLTNTGTVIDSNDETETTEKLMEDYYEASVDHNHPNFHIIRVIVKKERKYLHARINLLEN